MAPPPSFIPIKPAPASIAPSLPTAGTKRPNPVGAFETHKKPPSKRFKAVTQACNTCRRNKAKCDGTRPRCSSCENKGRECQYEGEEGQSRQEAMKARLAALEKVVTALQSKTPEEATDLLQRIRSVDDIVTLSSSDIDAESTVGSTTAKSAVTDVSRISSSQSSQGSSSGAGSLVKAKANAGRGQFDTACLIRLMIPSAELTRAAINSFFSSSGKLFHVFTKEQADTFYKNVFGPEGVPNTSQKVAIACICSIAAVGVQYNAIDFDKGAEQAFYEISRHFFINTVEESPLDAVKICAMLSMYNIMNKTTVALAFVETGMGLSQRWATNANVYLPLQKRPDWEEYRKTWRTLHFYSNWLSSTLGYISGGGESAFQKLVPLATPDHDPDYDFVEVVQVEMTKIALLKAEILKLHLAFKELTDLSLHAIKTTLQEWYSKLPKEMYLSNIGRLELEVHVRRSIFHVHLLYLGAVMLLYRRVVSQLVQSSADDYDNNDEGPTKRPSREALLEQAERGVTAAKHSARLLGLLLVERGVFKRCWLVIFQSHTSCVVILHSVAQKQLHNLPPSAWEDDLKQAQLCLDTLDYCGEMDPVAQRYHVRLFRILGKLASFSNKEVSTRQRTEDWVTMPPDFPMDSPREVADADLPADYLVTTPPGADKKIQGLAQGLMDALRSPFSETPENEVESDGTRSELAVATNSEQQAWGVAQKRPPFSWDTSELGLVPSADMINDNRFVGSECPNGWAAAADVGPDYDASS